MKKILIITLTIFLISMLFANIVFAETTNSPQQQLRQDSDREFYQRMWNYCHGRNGDASPGFFQGMGRGVARGMGMMGW